MNHNLFRGFDDTKVNNIYYVKLRNFNIMNLFITFECNRKDQNPIVV